jgi:hypothetical protein
MDMGNRQWNLEFGIVLILSMSVTPSGPTPLLGGDVEIPLPSESKWCCWLLIHEVSALTTHPQC